MEDDDEETSKKRGNARTSNKMKNATKKQKQNKTKKQKKNKQTKQKKKTEGLQFNIQKYKLIQLKQRPAEIR